MIMGTRAAFWVGDPRNLDAREWLGCVAWDGYPNNHGFATLLKASTEEEFRNAVAEIEKKRDDFAQPSGGWPFPWTGDIFLTDFTYAFFDGVVQVACFHSGFIPADSLDGEMEWPEEEDPTCCNVPSGMNYDRSQPDSIIIIGIPK